ncbi:MAG: insulinase family protein, partial [Phycisphaerae bacterium]|nr:insulinase family protein [Phycisphaerae bacterium]
DVMMYVLAAGESSPLRVELRDRKKLALSIIAASWTPSYVDGSFLVSGMCMPENWSALRDAILAEFVRLADSPLKPEELAQAKRQALVQHIRSLETAAGIGGMLASSQLAVGEAHFDDAYVKRLNQVTAAQVQAAAKKYFDTNKLLTTLIVPKGYKVLTSPGTAVPGSSTTRPDSGIVVTPVRKITLDNGLTVLLRRNSAVPLVAVQMHFAGGLLAEKPEQNGICQLMARTALRGTKTRSARDIAAAFEDAGGSIEANSGKNTFSFSASMLSDQLAATLPVFADAVLAPTFPADEVDQLKKQTLAAIARTDDQLEPSASRFFFARMFGDFAYGRPAIGATETVGKLTAADVTAFHKQCVLGRNGVLAIFGDIDLDATEKLVRQLFGKDALAAGEPAPQLPAPPAAGDKTQLFVQSSKLTKAAEVDMGFRAVSFNDKDYFALTMLDTIISGYNLPSGWLHETLRGRQLVYVVHAMNIGWRQTGLFYIYAQCQPDKVRQVIDGINEQLAKARRGEFTAEELSSAKSTALAGELMDLQTNDELAARCALDELLGLGYDNYEKLADRINAVTIADVARVARKYLANSVTTVTTCLPGAVEKK